VLSILCDKSPSKYWQLSEVYFIHKLVALGGASHIHRDLVFTNYLFLKN
jgi:hypothetical protein